MAPRDREGRGRDFSHGVRSVTVRKKPRRNVRERDERRVREREKEARKRREAAEETAGCFANAQLFKWRAI